MANEVTIPIEFVGVQLTNPVITAYAQVQFRRDGVEIGIDSEDFFTQVRLELRGSKIVALLSSSDFDKPQVITLYDFATADAAHSGATPQKESER